MAIKTVVFFRGFPSLGTPHYKTVFEGESSFLASKLFIYEGLNELVRTTTDDFMHTGGCRVQEQTMHTGAMGIALQSIPRGRHKGSDSSRAVGWNNGINLTTLLRIALVFRHHHNTWL